MSLLKKHNVILLAILLSATLMRFVGFVTTSPPGPEHDEVANWLIDRAILAGEHSVYFTQAYGHEAGFHYWQTLFVWLVGDNLVALRTPAALMGILAVAVAYALNRRLFGRNFALLTAALIATLFMPIFFSRLALRAISLPVTAGLAACFLWDGLHTADPSQGRRPFMLAALFAGLSSYTYMASRALPIFFVGLFVYLAIFHRPLFGSKWRDLIRFTAIYLVISLPLILFLQNLPAGETRIAEIDGPMRALRAGDFRPVFQNGLAILGGFGFSGDPLWRQGVAFKPIFDPLFAILFYGGLLLSLWRLRDLRHGFLLLWLGASIVPSLVTADAPSTIRMILMVPVLATFPIVGLAPVLSLFGFSLYRTSDGQNRAVVHSYPQLSTGNNRLSTRKMSFTLISVLTLGILAFQAIRSGRDVWRTWPSNPEVQFVWQQSLTDIGRYLDDHPEITHASIAGWSPDSFDSATLELVSQNDDVDRRFVGGVGDIQTLIIPSDSYALFFPADLPMHPLLQSFLQDGNSKEELDTFTVYTPFSPPQFPAQSDSPTFTSADSENQLMLLNVKPVFTNDASKIQLLTWWQVGEINNLAAPNTKLFLHVVDADGNLLAQHDGLDAPHRFWQAGDLIVQAHTVARPDTAAEMRLGVYAGQAPWPRFMLADGADFVTLPLP